MTLITGRLYEAKEWVADKVANEVGANISACDIFAVLKETEKAAYVMISIGRGKRKCTWIPKSAIIDITEQAAGEEGITARPLIINDNYDECVKAFKESWSLFI